MNFSLPAFLRHGEPYSRRLPMSRAHLLLAAAVLVVPLLFAYNPPPSPAFFIQALAMVGWGGWIIWMAATMVPAEGSTSRFAGPWKERAPLWALVAVLTVLALCAALAPLWTSAPSSLSRTAFGVLVAGLAALIVGWQAARAGHAEALFAALCCALVVAGGMNLLVEWVQVFAPGLADGFFISISHLPGRATGNMRQPNLLSTLQLMSCVALVWLGATAPAGGAGRGRQRWIVLAMVLLIFGVVLTGSRTGMVGMVLLAAWGVLDRRLPQGLRAALLLAPVTYLLWRGVAGWCAQLGVIQFGRVEVAADHSNARFDLWGNTLELISASPWTGVGFGAYNFAWTLTPLVSRPSDPFDHAHNLVLHFVAELGLPLGLAISLLAAWSLWGLFARVRQQHAGRSSVAPAALLMVLIVGVHSQLEYPLWYPYFLLPTLFVWGLGLGAGAASADAAATQAPVLSKQVTAPAFLGAAVVVGTLLAIWDYQRVAVIYAPRSDPLMERIAAGKRSLFFAHHAYYAAARSAQTPQEAIRAIEVARHNLIDDKLLRLWVLAEAAAGHDERASFLMHRLREFRRVEDEDLVAVCSAQAAVTARPGYCGPDAALTFRDFR